MDQRIKPPDKGGSHSSYVRILLTQAEDSKDFRRKLRRNDNIIDELPDEALLHLLKSLNIFDSTIATTEEAKTTVRKHLVKNSLKDGEKHATVPELSKSKPKRDTSDIIESQPRPKKQSQMNKRDESFKGPEVVSGSVGALMIDVTSALDRLQSVTQHCKGVVQAASSGISPEKSEALELLSRIQSSSDEVRGLQVGLRACQTAWRLLDEAEQRVKAETEKLNEMSTDIGPVPTSSYVRALRVGLNNARQSSSIGNC